jgi:Arc/MetJ family transcription regulator
MRTNIDIDETLIGEAMRLTGLKTKRAVVEEALRRLIKLRRQTEVLELYGKIPLDNDLKESRLGRDMP